MSLYHEASELIANEEKKGGSLKSRIFGTKGLKNPPAKLYALTVESLKWSPYLKEVIEGSGLLDSETKLAPTIAVLLVHDLLLAKGGIATPRTHPLRVSVEKHKARLTAEFTRCRIRYGFASLDTFRHHVGNHVSVGSDENDTSQVYRHPRWIRVNRLRTTWSELRSTTFGGYCETQQLEDVLNAPPKERLFYTDANIPDLVAVPPGHDLSKTPAYVSGQIILQDKASCFPAYLLDPASYTGDTIDTCAAPGNKTTHLAALAHQHRKKSKDGRRVFAFERDAQRSNILKNMVTRAGGNDLITVFGNKDFLTVRPDDSQFADVEALLLDPSCSGTGIIGRDDELQMHLPQRSSNTNGHKPSKKRKRSEIKVIEPPATVKEELENDVTEDERSLEERLRTLSAFQLQLIEHAMKFPKATRITYSTCSIHVEENEMVVSRALQSKIAVERGWRVLRRGAQVEGLRKWQHRGIRHDDKLTANAWTEELTEACIRCHKNTVDGTMGFFVVAFIRDREADAANGIDSAQKVAMDLEGTDENEWTGFSDDE